VPLDCAAPGRDKLAEHLGVDLVGRDGEPVAGRPVLDQIPAGRHAQPRGERLDGVLDVCGLRARPQILGQPVHRHGAAFADGESDEETAQPRTADWHRLPAGVPHLQRAEHADASVRVHPS
jgi:hypothetical protein